MIKSVNEFLKLIKNKYKDDEYEYIKKAVDLANEAHKGQTRASGEEYILHPLSVASILISISMDPDLIAAAILHDVLEDTTIKEEEIKQIFSEDVLDLVEGVTKINKIHFKSSEDAQAENLRKMLLAMSKDVRVIIVKLADRLHNMRTLDFKNKEKQKLISKETLDIYAPIAGRLGVGAIKCELEDLSMKYLYPDDYRQIKVLVNESQKEREKFMARAMDILKHKLKESNIAGEVNGRPKHIYSIFKKIQRGKSIDQIYDLTALRIIVPDLKDCYEMLGAIHTVWVPLPGRFKDYIAMPKPNFYQSLHTTVLSSIGLPFEIQIRTEAMHKVAEYGIAAHWKYKQGRSKASADKEDKLAWIREVLENQRNMPNSREFLNNIKTDLYPDEVFVFTPTGDVISLQYGSTALDFAYKVHSEVGEKCVGIKINKVMKPLGTQLENGDIIEVLTSKNSKGPSRDWLSLVKTNSAKSKIKGFFKRVGKQDNIKKGKELLEREAKNRGYNLSELFSDDSVIATLNKKYSTHNLEEIYSQVGYGDIPSQQIVLRLISLFNKRILQDKPEIVVEISKPTSKKKSSTGILIKGYDNFLVRLSKCCGPLPGDEIIGYITRGRGVCIHRKDCSNLITLEKERMIEAKWPKELVEGHKFSCTLSINAKDTIGVLATITATISKYNIPITNMVVKNNLKDNLSNLEISIEVANISSLTALIDKIKSIKDVMEVFRI